MEGYLLQTFLSESKTRTLPTRFVTSCLTLHPLSLAPPLSPSKFVVSVSFKYLQPQQKGAYTCSVVYKICLFCTYCDCKNGDFIYVLSIPGHYKGD